jgi:hypothetical protein
MPQTNEGIFLLVGTVLFIIGLLGGGIEIKNLKIPSIGKIPRIAIISAGVLFMILAGIKYLISGRQLIENSATLKSQTSTEITTKTPDIAPAIIKETTIPIKEKEKKIDAISSSKKTCIIYKGSSLSEGYDMGVDTSNRLSNWVQKQNDSMCMKYPGNQDWGSVYITFGKADLPYGKRVGNDYAIFKKVSFDLKGENGNEIVLIGLKDILDKDDGSERKYTVNITSDWKNYTYELSEFDTADLANIYVVLEFVFERETKAETIYFRNIQYLP